MRHPLHPALVHFPIAYWSLAVILDFASLLLGEWAWYSSSRLLLAGSTMAVPALLAGLFELPRVPRGAALWEAYGHMAATLGAFALFTTRLLIRLEGWQPLPPGTLALWLDALGFLSLAGGGWLGGRLVYGYGVGRS